MKKVERHKKIIFKVCYVLVFHENLVSYHFYDGRETQDAQCWRESLFQHSQILLLADQSRHHNALEEGTGHIKYQKRLENGLCAIRLKSNRDRMVFGLNNLILYFKTQKKQSLEHKIQCFKNSTIFYSHKIMISSSHY